MDKLGNTVFAGRFEGETTFGVGDRQTTFMSAGQEDGFGARYRPDKTLAWAVSDAGPHENAVVGPVADGNGKTGATGYFEADTTFFGTNDQPVSASTRSTRSAILPCSCSLQSAASSAPDAVT